MINDRAKIVNVDKFCFEEFSPRFGKCISRFNMKLKKTWTNYPQNWTGSKLLIINILTNFFGKLDVIF